MEDFCLPRLQQRDFTYIRITGKNNIHKFIKRIFMLKYPDGKAKTKRTFGEIKINKIITDQAISSNLETLNIKFVTNHHCYEELEFYRELCEETLQYLTPTERENIKFKHIYG